ncbi:protein kinase [Nocardia sp. NBC_01503]|uniref:serine/threonine-protein kinase n=1 Tax=Nocardia sp. NBC_01503 TaxID=2975997 RepID=UPI002E7B857D|nr:serine/threonine-protein kinase [Nocardia sp. NBC_01503]WTL34609.1 protein kinase [Nocardia sp. NBC_01503]
MAELRPGEVIAGYVIQRKIGSGGSGTVYVARHPRLPRLAAIKVMGNDEMNADAEAWRRFEREADITARFDHPNIVAVYDTGEDGGRLWISMQYIDGNDADALHGVRPERALRIGSGVASALDYAHGKGVLHRDVKPSNILLSPAEDGRAKRALLTDFGIARLRDESTHLTRTGDVAATFAYASPEQVSGAPLDPRTDQYSLACTLFVLLTGHRPYMAKDLAGWVLAHTQIPPLRITQVRPDLPRALDFVFDRALAKNPEYRFAGCADFVDAAWTALSGPATGDPLPYVSAPRPIPAVDPSRMKTTMRASGFTPNYEPDPTPPPAPVAAPARGSSRLLAGVLGGAIAILLAGGGFLLAYKLESSGNTSGAPLSAIVQPAATGPSGVSSAPAQQATPSATTVAAAPAGQIPAAFLGEWTGSSDQNNDDYRLTIRQGEVNQVVETSTVFRNGTLVCAFDYRLMAVSAGEVTVGGGVTTSGGSNCHPQATQVLRLTGGQIVRDLDISGHVTYDRVS